MTDNAIVWNRFSSTNLIILKIHVNHINVLLYFIHCTCSFICLRKEYDVLIFLCQIVEIKFQQVSDKSLIRFKELISTYNRMQQPRRLLNLANLYSCNLMQNSGIVELNTHAHVIEGIYSMQDLSLKKSR